MIKVREIIEDAYAAIGGLSDGNHVDGNRAVVGERFLNQLIASLNLNGFFAFQQTTLDFVANETKTRFKIGPEQPAGEPQPDIVAQRPAAVTSVFVGSDPNIMAAEVTLVNQAQMPGFVIESGKGLPLRCCYISSYPLGELWFDLQVPAGWTMRICFARTLPEMKIDDELPIPSEYQGALTWSLANTLTARYQVPPDVKATIKERMDFYVDPIRSACATRTPVRAYAEDWGTNNIFDRR